MPGIFRTMTCSMVIPAIKTSITIKKVSSKCRSSQWIRAFKKLLCFALLLSFRFSIVNLSILLSYMRAGTLLLPLLFCQDFLQFLAHGLHRSLLP